ncbi:MAG TPA: MFS transporter [Allosphingosinicella sp.]|jgi:MFS family permease
MESISAIPARKGRNGWSGTPALAALSLCMLMSSLGTSIANVALPTLAEAFDASFQQVQWVVLAYLLSVTVAVVGVGRLGDVVGRKRLLARGILLFTGAALLSGLAPTLSLLVAARALQGLAAAIMLALAMALAGEAVPAERRGRAMGVLGAMSAIGTALGPSLGGLLIGGSGWRSTFLVLVPIGGIAFALSRVHLPETCTTTGKEGASFDTLGMILLGAAVGAFALSMTIGRAGFGPLNLILLGTAAVGLLLFFSWQTHARAPLVQLSILLRPGVAAALWMSFLVSTVLMATLVVGPFYLTQALALAAPAAGAVLSVGPVVAALTGVPAGRAADRLGPGVVTVLGLAGIAAGCVLLGLLPVEFGLFGYIPAIAVLTFGYALFQTANNVAVMAAAGADQRGVVSGLLNLSRNLGLVTGVSAMGAVFAGGAGTAAIAEASPDAVAAATRLTFMVAALLMLPAFALAAGRMKRWAQPL